MAAEQETRASEYRSPCDFVGCLPVQWNVLRQVEWEGWMPKAWVPSESAIVYLNAFELQPQVWLFLLTECPEWNYGIAYECAYISW
jgi:hypothetical protein